MLLFFIMPLRQHMYTIDKTIKQKHHPRKNLTEVRKHEHYLLKPMRPATPFSLERSTPQSSDLPTGKLKPFWNAHWGNFRHINGAYVSMQEPNPAQKWRLIVT